MPREILDLKPVSRITADAVGEPGSRVFYLQAHQGSRSVTVLVEKEQVQALAVGIEQLLEQVDKQHGEVAEEEISEYDLLLEEPLEPVFRAGQMGLGYDEEEGLLILVVQEFVGEGERAEDAAVARFGATRAQMRALSRHALDVVQRGRPICPLCGRPMDPTGHFCPPSNGHNRETNVLP